MSKILYVPAVPHEHYVDDFRRKPVQEGTVAICDGCGKTIVYKGDFNGTIDWWTEGWFHRWRREQRNRKKLKS